MLQRALTTSAVLVLLAACEGDKPAPTAASAAASAAPLPSAMPAAPAAAPTPKPDPGRPEKLDLTLTPERRTAIEAKYSAAKGFLAVPELEAKLQGNKALKDAKKALSEFDRLAKGKWLLFAGNVTNLTAQGFDMGVVYTPQIPGDSIGMSKQWFPVTSSSVEGYQKDAFKGGDLAVVLVKYNGDGKAGPGYELVSAGVWR